MDKRAVIQNMHSMIDTRLFGPRSWLADEEACIALMTKLDELGLQEPVPEDTSLTRATALGKELELELVMVFIGLWCEWEIPGILEAYGLIDEIEESRLYAQIATSDDLDLELGPIVRKAYLDYYNPSGLSV